MPHNVYMLLLIHAHLFPPLFYKGEKNDINFSFQQCPQAAHTFSATFELAGEKKPRKEEIKIAIRFFFMCLPEWLLDVRIFVAEPH